MGRADQSRVVSAAVMGIGRAARGVLRSAEWGTSLLDPDLSEQSTEDQSSKGLRDASPGGNPSRVRTSARAVLASPAIPPISVRR